MRTIFNLNTLFCTAIIISIAVIIQYSSHNSNKLEISCNKPYIITEGSNQYLFFQLPLHNSGISKSYYSRQAGDLIKLRLNNGIELFPRNKEINLNLEIDAGNSLSDTVSFDLSEFGKYSLMELVFENAGKVYKWQFTKYEIKYHQ